MFKKLAARSDDALWGLHQAITVPLLKLGYERLQRINKIVTVVCLIAVIAAWTYKLTNTVCDHAPYKRPCHGKTDAVAFGSVSYCVCLESIATGEIMLTPRP
jgi:hypothetical protein